ncbi:MAG: hypothetical protein JSS09_07550, partial [Verrucomicrobia bacterium]|nr:hypothetical protein [Verrucomicrobiota bacterium]
YLSYSYAHPLKDKDFPAVYGYLPDILKKWALSKQMDSWQEGGSHFFFEPPQVRLLTSKLTQENEILILSHSTLPEGRMKQLEDEIEKILSSLPKKMESYLWRKKFWRVVYDFFGWRT